MFVIRILILFMICNNNCPDFASAISPFITLQPCMSIAGSYTLKSVLYQYKPFYSETPARNSI